jgi:hypothetical protein
MITESLVFRLGSPARPVNSAATKSRQQKLNSSPVPKYLPIAAGLLIFSASSALAGPSHYPGRTEYRAPESALPMSIDGVAREPAWAQARWQALSHRWLGPEYTAEDFKGRYKVVWTQSRIYILAEITDDILFDSHRDPLQQYWDDDCLEIFIDEDFSGGDHQYNHNAFAYHLSLDNQAIDIGTDEQPHNYSHHVDSRWRQDGNKIIWEVAIDVYTDNYSDGSSDNRPVALSAGKVLGLMVAYCDNDGSELRENFIGSESVPSGPKDRGWIDAGLFGSLVLDE